MTRDDGKQVRIVAQEFFGTGLHRSVGYYVLRRDRAEDQWSLCNNSPAPGWKQMPRAEYIAHGRSETLRTVSIGELLKTVNQLRN
jgi:hypothetical protein